MATEAIIASIAVLSESFPRCRGQPTGEWVHDLEKALYKVLLDIEYDREKGKHSLIGLLEDPQVYEKAHGEAFKPPKRRGAYDDTLKGDETPGERAKKEATHKAGLWDRGVYTTTVREVRNFILSMVDKEWVLELEDEKTYYHNVSIRDLLDHLELQSLGAHAVDLTALKSVLQNAHTEHPDVFKYINALEAGKKQAARIARKNGRKTEPLTDDDLMDYAVTAYTQTGQFPRANDEWDDLRPDEKTWTRWKTIFKEHENRARVKVSASGANSFGATGAQANAVADDESAPPEPSLGRPGGEWEREEAAMIGAVEQGFEDLAQVAEASNASLAKLVESNAKLAESNKILTAQVATLQKKINILENGGGGGPNAAGKKAKKKKCPHCDDLGVPVQGPHKPEDCLELPKNRRLRGKGWKSVWSS